MYKFIKRLFDFISAFCLFIVISPMFLFIMLLVRIKIGKPVFFKQERVTKDLKNFYIIKFRTMTNARDDNGNYLPDEQRLTGFGKFLRSTSLDELPELINIIKGDMSVIGPRPLPAEYNDYYTDYESERFKVSSGLIPPEVLYNTVFPSWDEQLKYEAEYANNNSVKLDLKVMVAVFKVLFGRYSNDFGQYVREPLSIERREKERV